MIIHKEYMKVMRAGKQWTPVSKQNDAGMIVALCIFIASAIFFCALARSCDVNDLSPQLQKAYHQLEKASNGDFKVSVRC